MFGCWAVLLPVLLQAAVCQYSQSHTHQHQHTHDYDQQHIQKFQRGSHGGGVNTTDASGCNGMLHSPCVCNTTSVVCVNAQFTNSNILLRINAVTFSHLTQLTFKGNNFQTLNSSIFGAGSSLVHSSLVLLNLSSNYIVHVHERALDGVPGLRCLDMTDNEIVLDGVDERRLFAFVPRLRLLYLRRAFNPNVNQTLNTQYLTAIFEAADLKQLRELDLSFNGLRALPYQLGCYFPALRTLDLSLNQLTTLNLNGSCFTQLDTLNIKYNGLLTMGLPLRRTADALPAYSLLASGNRYHCDCNAVAYLNWLRQTQAIQDLDRMRCHRASPAEFDEALMTSVDVDALDCSRNLTATAVITARPGGTAAALCALSSVCTAWALVGCSTP